MKKTVYTGLRTTHGFRQPLGGLEMFPPWIRADSCILSEIKYIKISFIYFLPFLWGREF